MGVLGAGTVNVNNNRNSNASVVVNSNRSVEVAPEPPCQCTVDHFLAPLKFKMKGLKKIRKKIGLGMCTQSWFFFFLFRFRTKIFDYLGY